LAEAWLPPHLHHVPCLDGASLRDGTRHKVARHAVGHGGKQGLADLCRGGVDVALPCTQRKEHRHTTTQPWTPYSAAREGLQRQRSPWLSTTTRPRTPCCATGAQLSTTTQPWTPCSSTAAHLSTTTQPRTPYSSTSEGLRSPAEVCTPCKQAREYVEAASRAGALPIVMWHTTGSGARVGCRAPTTTAG
jgi:hypothetical protein